MEFSDLGAHCSVSLCGQHDFLPFKCQDCQQMFCRQHRTQTSHECPNYVEQNVITEDRPKVKRPFKCSLRGCKKGEWIKMECNDCGFIFCLNHRAIMDHRCGDNTVIKKKVLDAASAATGIACTLSATAVASAVTNSVLSHAEELRLRRDAFLQSVMNDMNMTTQCGTNASEETENHTNNSVNRRVIQSK